RASSDSSARREPAREPAELDARALPQERSRLQRAPEPGRLAGDERGVWLTGDRRAEEWELLDRRRRSRVAEVGHGLSFRRGEGGRGRGWGWGSVPGAAQAPSAGS